MLEDRLTVREAGLKHLSSMTVRCGAALVGGMDSSNELSETDIIENVVHGETVIKAGSKILKAFSGIDNMAGIVSNALA